MYISVAQEMGEPVILVISNSSTEPGAFPTSKHWAQIITFLKSIFASYRKAVPSEEAVMVFWLGSGLTLWFS